MKKNLNVSMFIFIKKKLKDLINIWEYILVNEDVYFIVSLSISGLIYYNLKNTGLYNTVYNRYLVCIENQQ